MPPAPRRKRSTRAAAKRAERKLRAISDNSDVEDISGEEEFSEEQSFVVDDESEEDVSDGSVGTEISPSNSQEDRAKDVDEGPEMSEDDDGGDRNRILLLKKFEKSLESFSHWSAGTRPRALVVATIKLLQKLSGHDLIGFMRAVLTPSQIKRLNVVEEEPRPDATLKTEKRKKMPHKPKVHDPKIESGASEPDDDVSELLEEAKQIVLKTPSSYVTPEKNAERRLTRSSEGRNHEGNELTVLEDEDVASNKDVSSDDDDEDISLALRRRKLEREKRCTRSTARKSRDSLDGEDSGEEEPANDKTKSFQSLRDAIKRKKKARIESEKLDNITVTLSSDEDESRPEASTSAGPKPKRRLSFTKQSPRKRAKGVLEDSDESGDESKPADYVDLADGEENDNMDEEVQNDDIDEEVQNDDIDEEDLSYDSDFTDCVGDNLRLSEDDMSEEEEEEEEVEEEEDTTDVEGSDRDYYEPNFKDILDQLSRKTPRYTDANQRYYEAADKPYRKDKSKGVTKDDKKYAGGQIYKSLVEGLRREKLGSRKGLTDSELIKEFVLYETDIASECDGTCVCGKEGLRYLFFIENKNVKDLEKRKLHHTTIVGSECINWFYKATGSPMIVFDIFLRQGITGFYRMRSKKRGYIFSIAGKSKEKILHHRKQLQLDYNLQIRFRTVKDQHGRNIQNVDLIVHPGEVGKDLDDIKESKKYRLFLKTNADSEDAKRNVRFEVTRLEEATKAVTSDKVQTGQDFIKK